MDFGARNEEECEKRVCVGADEIFKKGKRLVRQRDGAHTSTSQAGSSASSAAHDEKVPDGNGRGCPVNKDRLGESSWNLLHTMSVYYPEKPTDAEKDAARTFMKSFAKLYPCDVCAKDLQQDVERIPPKVNEKMGKPLFDCSKVLERWRDGWKDGSCD